MTATEYVPDVNLGELRDQLTSRAAILLLVSAAGLVAWLSLRHQALPMAVLGLAAALAGLGIGTRRLTRARPALARHLLMWCLTGGLLVAMVLLSAPRLAFLGLPLILLNGMLFSGGEVVTAGLLAALAAWLTGCSAPASPLPLLLVAIALDTALTWLVRGTLFSALDWAWTMEERAEALLELARDREGHLSRALKSLELTDAILRRTQRELIVARRQAERARLMKEQFAANVSHELRTPLNLVLGFSEIMCLSSEVYGNMEWPPALRRDVYRIYQSSCHLLEMIDDILTLSRFETVGFTLDRRPTRLETLAQEAVEIVGHLCRDRPIRLEVDIAANLPTLEIDRTRIRQVLLNLLNNAIRFTEQGTVRLEARRADGEVVVSVSDTGPGIPEDELPNLFQQFYQVDRSLARKHGGTGLGLAISKAFVESHDGRIWVESEVEVGSTLTFTLPIPGKHVPLSKLQESQPLKPSRPGVSPPILIADPDPSVASLIGSHIEQQDVVQLEDVSRLTEAVLLHHPRAVVLNVPPRQSDGYGDGLQVSVPIIECSLPSQAWVTSDLAVSACLTKPIRADQLLRAIDRVGNVRDVLVVDDDLGFCQLVERMLQSSGRGFKVRRAYSGSDGLLALRAQRPDVLLLDLIMPGEDGFHVLGEMRRDTAMADTPVILLTATSLAEDLLSQRSGQIVIRRPDGLRPVEVLKCLRAVINVLEPHYDERSVPDTVTPSLE
jgi:signal transduction histidine kinase/CheY-like chemotaxis protein